MAVFSPASSKILSASATSVALSIDAAFSNIRIYNSGPNKTFIRWGVGSQSAVAATDMCLAPDSVELFDKGVANNMAAICSATESCVLYITQGNGV